MFEILKNIFLQIPDFFPTLVFFIILWILAGWFYDHVLGGEIKDFLVFSIMVFIILCLFLLFTNHNAQVLLFGLK
jgi:hypothetical protein